MPPSIEIIMINDYSFGKIIINDKKYNKDIEVRWNGKVLDWWRDNGHVFALVDLKRALEQKPEVVILGTGAYGAAQVSEDVKKELEARRIKLIIEKTGEAVKIFNKAIQQEKEKRIIGLFHLTC
ncbi:hypothetical protein KAU19_01855 [Candidatus Parcubacteria bacterium]|nr:hypothetical protein [Candidatus Parcubacteria bacterium]